MAEVHPNASAVHTDVREPPKKLHPDLLRSVAIAAIRLDRLPVALEYLHDNRLSPFHAISILRELCIHMRVRGPLDLPARRQLARIVADFVRNLANVLPSSLATVRVQQLLPVILMLYYFRFFGEGTGLILALRDPFKLGPKNLAAYLRVLVHYGFEKSILSIYSRMSPEKIGKGHFTALLESSNAHLSDTVWRDLLASGDKRTEIDLLHARLKHHLSFKEPSTKRVLEDHADGINILGMEPTMETDRLLFCILLKAGRLRRAMEIFEKIKDYASTSDTLNRLLVSAQKTNRSWFTQRRGPVSKLTKVSKTLLTLTEDQNLPMDGVTANILLKASLRWGEMDNSAIWASLTAGLAKSEMRDWHRELRPLFKMIIRAFLTRGNREAAREAVDLMIRTRIQKTGR